MEKVTELLNSIKSVPTELLVVLATALGAILFVPDNLATTLAVDGFRNAFRVFLGPAFILVAAWLLARTLRLAAKPIVSWRVKKRRAEQLSSLTVDEKGYLIEFIENGKNTIHVRMEDGIVGGLLAKGVVYRASNVFDVLEGVPYNLQPWAREFLEKNPHLLSGGTSKPIARRLRLTERFRDG